MQWATSRVEYNLCDLCDTMQQCIVVSHVPNEESSAVCEECCRKAFLEQRMNRAAGVVR